MSDYDENLDVVLAEDMLSDGKTSVLVRSYNKGEPKIAIVKGGYPLKRIPLSQWEEITNAVLTLKDEIAAIE